VAGVRELLPRTDRERLLSIVFDPRDAQRHLEAIAPMSVRGPLLAACEWLDPATVESAAWSMHLDEFLYADLLLQKNLATKLDALPRDLLKAVQDLRPAGPGRRQLVGRLPAMTKAFAVSTRLHAGDRFVTMQTVLPDLAAPNLALATRLAWEEAGR
jgi:hypothetical protein